jgi:hypothetical protein
MSMRSSLAAIVQVRQTRFHRTRLLAGQSVYLVETDQHLLVFDNHGTEPMKYRWPRPALGAAQPETWGD